MVGKIEIRLVGKTDPMSVINHEFGFLGNTDTRQVGNPDIRRMGNPQANGLCILSI